MNAKIRSKPEVSLESVSLLLLSIALVLKISCPACADTHHIWQKQEIVLAAEGSYENPYTEVEVWVDLRGPGFDK